MNDRGIRADRVIVEPNVSAKMRDGVVLKADIYRPDGAGPFPVLLTRTPYDKKTVREMAYRFAKAGYIVAAQDIRGRYESEGEFLPIHGFGSKDVEDGFDTVAWAAELPDSTSQVGMFGSSYSAWTSWKAAASAPPALKCVYVSGMSLRHSDVEPIFRPGRRLEWSFATIGPDDRRRTAGAPGPYDVEEARELWKVERNKWLWVKPWSELSGELLPSMATRIQRILEHPGEDYHEFAGIHRNIDVPVFNRTGWYDRFIPAVDHFVEMEKLAPSERARRSQRLVVGPWGHTNDLTRAQGEFDFGEDAEWDNAAVGIGWFDHWLKSDDNGTAEEARVRLFITGENSWRGYDDWPIPGTRPVEFQLSSRGNANTPAGDGTLSREPAGGARSDSFNYNPRDPVPSLFLEGCQDGPFDQKPLDHRRDVLVYQSAPLSARLTVVGAPSVKLHASSSAVDTDFTAKLVDVSPDGTARNLCYGIVRARFRYGWENLRLLDPGEITEFAIELNPVGNTFLEGHRIRLDVSSSDFPNYDRNHNTGGDAYSESEMIVAHQEVHHSQQHPSTLRLPVVSS